MDYEVKAENEVEAAQVDVLRGEVAALTAELVKAGRPALGREAVPERKAFADGYLRKGIAAPEVKAMSLADSDGGYAVPVESIRRST